MVSIVFDPGGANELTIPERDIVTINPVLTHTGESDFRGTLATSKNIFEFAKRQDRTNVIVNGDTKFTGFITDASENRDTGRTNIEIIGIAKKLEETRPDYQNIGGKITISSKALDDAIDDYWDRTPFDNVTVKDQPTSTVQTDVLVQEADTNSEFSNITSIPSTEPFVVQNNNLELAQTAHFAEGEDNIDNAGVQQASSASDGEYAAFGLEGSAVNKTFSLDYTVDSSNVGAAWRYKVKANDPDSDGNDESFGVKVTVDGNTIRDDVSAVDYLGAQSFGWDSETGLGSDISGGTSLRVEAVGTPNGDPEYHVDCIVLYDTRFHSAGFDNSTDSNGYLSSPALFPTRSLDFSQETTSLNIVSGTANLTTNDANGVDALEISFDGTNFSGDTNTTSVTEPNPGSSRSIEGKVTLGAFGSRTTASPTENFRGQVVDTWELLVDLSDKLVIDELELTRNHFENLLELHNFGDYQFTIEHSADDISDMFVQSYYRGDVSKPKPDGFDNPQNQNREIASKKYYNSIFVQGGEDAQGNRPSAEQKDQDEINDVGREISPGVLRDPKITTEGGADFRAQALLSESVRNNLRTGSVTVPLEFAQPGYSYPVDFGNGEKDKIAEEINIKLGTNDVTAEYQFELVQQLRQEVSQLRRNARRTQDKV